MPSSRNLVSSTPFWFGLALLIPLYYSIVSVGHGLRSEYIVHHDARLHIVWLQQYVDPDLFPQDFIAEYFQAFAPVGYKAMYWGMAQLGIEPLVLAKYVPIPIAVLTSIYCFGLSLQLLPVPAGAFMTTLLFNQGFWFRDDIISATPRSFAYLLIAAFLYYVLKRRLWLCLGVILLQGWFYPFLVLISVGILLVRLLRWSNQRLQLSLQRLDYGFAIAGLCVALVALWPTLDRPAEFGSIVTGAQMQIMPEFRLSGRSPYFGVNPLLFWLRGDSGLRLPILPPTLWLGWALPWVLRSKLPLVDRVTSQRQILWQILWPTLVLYSLAHFALLKLYLPSRYTYYGFRFILTLATGIVITIGLASALRWLRRQWQHRAQLTAQRWGLIGGLLFLVAAGAVVPAVPPVFLGSHYWHVIREPALYEFLAQQPKTSLVASLSKDADNVPSLTQRSVLVSRNVAIAYHTGYYKVLRRRIIDVFRAQYSLTLAPVQQVIQTYGIDWWLVDRNAFDPDYVARNGWLMQFQPVASRAIENLQQGHIPALAQTMDRCSVFQSDSHVVLAADCILAQDSLDR